MVFALHKNKGRTAISQYLKHQNQKLACKAPFSSLYFNADGSITPCCVYLPGNEFGLYQPNSLERILDSEKRKTLQKNIGKGILPDACIICNTGIVAGDYNSVIASQFNKLITGLRYPDKLEFDLSHFCNFDCIMCGTHTHTNQPGAFNSEHFLDELIPYLEHARFCNFYGGEPFLNPLYFSIWETIARVNPHCLVYIQTNASVYNEKVLRVLNRLNVLLGVSLDAIDNALLESIRKGANAPEIKHNIGLFSALMQQQNRHLEISVTPMSLNLDEIPHIVEFCNSVSAGVFFNTLNFPRHLSPARMLPQQLNVHIKTLQAHSFENNKAISLENQKKYDSFIQRLVYLMQRNGQFEQEYTKVTACDLIKKLSEQLPNSQLAAQFIDAFSDTDPNRELSPVVVGDLYSIPASLFSKTIAALLEQKNYQRVKQIIDL